MQNNEVKSKSLLRNRLFWAGLVVAVVGLVFNLGWFFIPLNVWLDDPGLVPMPRCCSAGGSSPSGSS